MLAKKTSKNQLTLPKEIVKAFPDAEYFDVSVKEQEDSPHAGQNNPCRYDP